MHAAMRPDTGMRSIYPPGTAAAARSLKTAGSGRMTTTANIVRPMSSMRAAGFSSRGRTGALQSAAFDPLKMAAAKANGAKAEPSPEEQVKTAERKILQFIHDSNFLREEGHVQKALERAKEAGKRERQLTKQREQLSLSEASNLDLTYCVLVNLADQYYHAKMYQEAINTYNVIVKNKLFSQSGRLRVNIGNIYFETKKFSQAIKMYRMALDQIPQTNRDIRLKILRNIGNAFVITGQFQDAITSYETVMETNPDHHTGFNLLLCYFALGLRDKMRKGFQRMVSLRPSAIEQAEDNLPFTISDTDGNGRNENSRDDNSNAHHTRGPSSSPHSATTGHGRGNYSGRRGVSRSGVSSSGTWRGTTNDERGIENDTVADHYVFTQDNLRALAIQRKKTSDRYILMSAKLIASVVESTPGAGYDWLVETIKSSPAADMASELEVSKALAYLKAKEFSQAIETLKAFERKDQKMMATAATNLSFLYFLEEEIDEALKYADLAVNVDRYNAKAMTNKGNCFFAQGQYNKAIECYDEAANMDALCTEAIFNLGLVHKQTGNLTDALRCFEKLHAILRGNPEVILHIADIHERVDNVPQALEWYSILISLVPTDPGVLCKIAALYTRDGDKAQSFHYYSESYRYYPANIDVISWLGSYYIDCEVYEQAMQFFERAAIVQPNEIKWQMMTASCMRRSGNHQLALDIYKKIHERWPTNVECLRYILRIATDLGMKEVPDYAAKLSKVEKSDSEREIRDSATSVTSSTTKLTRPATGQSSASNNNERAKPNATLSQQNVSGSQNVYFDGSFARPASAIKQKPQVNNIKKNGAEEWDDDVGSMLPD